MQRALVTILAYNLTKTVKATPKAARLLLTLRENPKLDESSIFVRILKLGEEKGLIGINENQFGEWALSQPEIKSEHDDAFQKALRIFRESFDRLDKSHGIPDEYVLKNEYYFRLVEFRELELARRSAVEANRHSKLAIAISVVAIIVGAAATFTQLASPISIDEEQAQQFMKYQNDIIEELRSLNKSMQPSAKAPAD